MDKSEVVCVSSHLTDRQVSIKNPAREGLGTDFDSTSLANPAMVSNTEGVIVPGSDSSPLPNLQQNVWGGTPPPIWHRAL